MHFVHAQLVVKEFHGIFAAPFVPRAQYEKVKRSQYVKPDFAKRDRIDIVVTSLAAVGAENEQGKPCEHGYLQRYLQDPGARGQIRALKKQGWKGDVHLRPFSSQGPIAIRSGRMPITLFEIDELVQMARDPEKMILVMASPCTRCGASKARAVLDLIDQQKLHLWTHLVLDHGTAHEMVDGRPLRQLDRSWP